VANENAQSISVLDTATGAQTAAISLSAYNVNPYGAVLSPDGTTLYVLGSIYSSVNLLAIDTASYAVLFDDTLPGVPGAYTTPNHMPPPAISADGQTIYVAAYEFVVFDTASQTVTATLLPAPGYLGAEGLAVTPDGSYAVVTGNADALGSGQLSLIDLLTLAIVKQISLYYDEFIGPVVCSPDGSLAYFVSSDSGTQQMQVAVLDIARQRVVKTFPAGTGAGKTIAIAPDGSEIEIGDSHNATVVAMNAVSGVVTAPVATLGQMLSITVSADGQSLYVPNYDSSIVEVIDPATSRISAQIPAGSVYSFFDNTYTLRVSANGRRAVVTGYANLSVIDTIAQRLIGVVPLAGSLKDVALSPHGDAAYVVVAAPSGGTARILEVDVNALKVAAARKLTAADWPVSAALSPDASMLYVAERNCPTEESCVQQLLEIDPVTLQVVGQILLSPEYSSIALPGDMVVTADGAAAYVLTERADLESVVVSVVDLTQGVVVAAIPAGGGNALALGPDQRILFVTEGLDVFAIDLKKRAVAAIYTGVTEYPSKIAVSPSGDLVYVTSSNTDSLDAIDTGPNPPTQSWVIPLPGTSGGVGFSPW
jgi:YVTN family beta-propeller protein